MTNLTSQERDLRRTSLNLDERARELASLQHEVTQHPVTPERLTAWVGESVARRILVAATVFATIRWEKSLGRPLVPNRASSFVVSHQYCVYDWVMTEAGPKDVGGWIKQSPPSLYDLPDNGNVYRVGLMSHCVTGKWLNEISVGLATNVQWEIPISSRVPGFTRIEPVGQVFSVENDWFTVLNDFNVVHAVA